MGYGWERRGWAGGDGGSVGVRWGMVGREGGGRGGDGGSVGVKWGMVGREGGGRGEMEVL